MQEDSNYYGKCFDSLQKIKEKINSISKKKRCQNDKVQLMKNHDVGKIFIEMHKKRNLYINVKDAYCAFLETFLNLNPSIAEDSYNNGMTYIDNPSPKIFYMLESFFEVSLNVFKVHEQKNHSVTVNNSKKKSQNNPYQICSLGCSPNTCKKTKCYHVSTIYSSCMNNKETLNVVITNLEKILKENKYLIRIIAENNLYEFINTFEPLIGFAFDSIILKNKTILCASEIKSLNIHVKESEVYIADLLNNNIINPFNTNITILKPVSFTAQYSKNNNINNIYNYVNFIKAISETENNLVLIILKVGPEKYNIIKSCLYNIEEIFRIGPKKTIDRYSPISSLKNKKQKKNKIEKFINCPCEHFSQFNENKILFDFHFCQQQPLKFNKKSLPIHISLLDFENISDFKLRISIASKISHCFFDIESLTSNIPNKIEKHPGIYLKFQDLVNSIIGYHKIIMIGYSDLLLNKTELNIDSLNLEIFSQELEKNNITKLFHIDIQ